MTTAAPPPGRLHALDGLRGAAALVVVIHHGLLVLAPFDAAVNGAPAPSGFFWLVNTPLHLVWAGGEAVLVFFVLSGLVLTRAATASSTFSWRAYYPTRLIRLYLPVLGAIALAYLLALLVSRSGLTGDPWLVEHQNALKIGNVVRDGSLVLPGRALNSPLWSLRWEVVFSLTLPAYIWIARRLSVVLLIAASLLLSGVGAVWLTRGSSSDAVVSLAQALCFLPVFMVGVVIALRLDQVRAWLERREGATPVLTAAGILLLTLPWTLGTWLYAPRTAALLVTVVLGATAWVLVAITPGITQRGLESRPMQWLGKTSFSIYLTHEPLLISLAVLLPLSLRWLALPIALPLALLLGFGFFWGVEHPSHRLAQRVNRALRHSPERQPA